MASLNRIMLMGNLTREAELRYTPTGTPVTEIGLAINRRYKQGDETREEVTFVDITLWGRTAEVVAEYTRKGSPLYVEGRLQMDSWEDKATGQKRTRLKVVGEAVQMLGSGPGKGGTQGRPDGAE